MPVTSVETDPASLTLTATGEYPVPVERLWAAWADPRQIERFWGPPEWPTTFTRHDMTVGGRSEYAMTGPLGEHMPGYWVFKAVDAPNSFSVLDGFCDADGNANDEMPSTTMDVRFEATATGSRFVVVSTFASLEAMEALVAMGMVEGFTTALAQLDNVLDDLRDHSAGFHTALKVVDDTTVRVSRTIRGPLNTVWQAHHEPKLVRQWMLGPDGWTMPECNIAQAVGDSYRYKWENTESGESFGFEGEVQEQEAPRREVFSQRMIGVGAPGTANELALRPLPGGHTQLDVTITYANKDMRDMVLGTGMVDGMEASYARLESVVATP